MQSTHEITDAFPKRIGCLLFKTLCDKRNRSVKDAIIIGENSFNSVALLCKQTADRDFNGSHHQQIIRLIAALDLRARRDGALISGAPASLH